MDYAAATPLHKDAKMAMESFWNQDFGNAGSVHHEGVVAKGAVDNARQDIASTLEVRPSEIIFTANGTEANNLALKGVVQSLADSGRSYDSMSVVTSRIEHPSVLMTVKYLINLGVKVQYVDVDKVGLVDLGSLRSLLTKETVLVSLSYVNSEVGTITPVRSVVRAIAEFNRQHQSKILLHVDAAQAPLWLDCKRHKLGADIMTFDAGKFNGPKGVGFLVHDNAVPLRAQQDGGGQEQGLRSGTENVPGIVGMAVAFGQAQVDCAERATTTAGLRDAFIKLLQEKIPGVIINGPAELKEMDNRVANNINISLLGLDAEFAVVVLDQAGIAASTRSACGGKDTGGSHVVREIGGEERANSTLRFTLGPENTWSEVTQVVAVLQTHISKMSTIKNA